MIAAHRRRTEKLDREKVFLIDNAADFARGTQVVTISDEIDLKLVEALADSAAMASALGDKLQAYENKGDARDRLLDVFREIVLGAAAIGDAAVPGITAKYKIPEPRTGGNLIASADAWFADTATPLEELFVAAGLDLEFRAALTAAKTAFQNARDNADRAIAKHGEAVGGLDALWRDVMKMSRRRSALVKLKYRDDPGKLAAWAIASHLERAPRRKAAPDKAE